jgi:hypothetical protein
MSGSSERGPMEITDVVVHTLSLPAVESSKADGSQDACILEVETDEGITGIGEADSSPRVAEAIVEAPVSHDKSAGLKEVVLGRDPFDVEVLWNEMYDRTYFYGRKGAAITAISAVDMALWDIIGRATGRPLYRLLGGKHRDSVRGPTRARSSPTTPPTLTTCAGRPSARGRTGSPPSSSAGAASGRTASGTSTSSAPPARCSATGSTSWSTPAWSGRRT